jgi:PAS domain S-box-containing protein
MTTDHQGLSDRVFGNPLQSQEALLATLSANPDCMELVSAEGNVTFVNAPDLALYGFKSLGEAVGRSFAERFAASDQHRLRLAIAEAARGCLRQVECLFTAGDPPLRLALSFAPAHFAAASDTVVVASRALGPPSAVTQDSRAGADRLSLLAHSTPDMVWTATADGGLDWCGARMLDFTGLSMDRLAGHGWYGTVHAEDVKRVERRWADALATGDAFEVECRLRAADGGFRWQLGRATAVRAADGTVQSWVGCFADIDRLKNAADALARDNEQLEQDIFTQLHEVKQTQSRLQAYFDSSPDYLYLMRLSKDGGLIYEDLNPAALTLHTAERSAIVGRRPAEVDPGAAEEIETQVRRCLRTGKPVNYLAERTIDAEPVFVQVVGAPLDYSNEEEGLVLLCGRDITEQRAIEEALRQSQKMEAVGQLTGGLAHDFNNLLTGITGSLDLLQLRMAQGRFENLERYLTGAQSAAARAASLTHRLLAFSRRQTLDPKPLETNHLVRDMEDLLKRTVGPEIALDVVTADDLWTVLVDPSQLENALLNLCINARDAMPEGGRITVETQNVRLGQRNASERDLPAGDYVALSVTDNGSGMPPHIIERIFDPFFTTKPLGMGTGLGLSMIYGFARQSGGQVRVHSMVGAGTTMRILLPRHYGPAESPHETKDLSVAPRSEAGETVLVVDDEATIRMLVTEVLQDLGYNAIEATDGASGLMHLKSSRRIDLLVTDVGLPGGMNGRQVAEAGRALRPDLKILFITGYAENAVLNHGHLEPGMQVLTKPFAMEALASRIKILINETPS